MVTFNKLEEFLREVNPLITSAPGRVRISLAYRHTEGVVRVKVTDNIKTFNYCTGEKEELRHIEKLQLLLLSESIDPTKSINSADFNAIHHIEGSDLKTERKPFQNGSRISGAQKRKLKKTTKNGEKAAKGPKPVSERLKLRRQRKLARRHERAMRASMK